MIVVENVAEHLRMLKHLPVRFFQVAKFSFPFFKFWVNMVPTNSTVGVASEALHGDLTDKDTSDLSQFHEAQSHTTFSRRAVTLCPLWGLAMRGSDAERGSMGGTFLGWLKVHKGSGPGKILGVR